MTNTAVRNIKHKQKLFDDSTSHLPHLVKMPSASQAHPHLSASTCMYILYHYIHAYGVYCVIGVPAPGAIFLSACACEAPGFVASDWHSLRRQAECSGGRGGAGPIVASQSLLACHAFRAALATPPCTATHLTCAVGAMRGCGPWTQKAAN